MEKNKEKSGEYRIDSDAYPDAFQYKITENKEISFFSGRNCKIAFIIVARNSRGCYTIFEVVKWTSE